MKFVVATTIIWCLFTSSSAHNVDGTAARSHDEEETRGKVRTGHSSKVHEKKAVPRIVGGSQASPGEFPYYVDMGGCGASLIAPGIAMGAAHCGDYTGDWVTVDGYSRSLDANAKVVKQVNYTHWDGYTGDLMLMKLDVDDGFKPSSNTQLKLNKNKNFPSSAGELMTVLGLGMTYEGGPDAQVLKHVEVPYIEPETCANVWGDAVVDEQGVLLCAGGRGGLDACEGDSGGPLVKENGSEHVQVGIVSFGDGCGIENINIMYMRVSGYMDWIEHVVCACWGVTTASFCDSGSYSHGLQCPT